MKPTNIFMTGNWEYLIISTFEVKKEMFEKYLPNGTELDLYNDKALLSMVAFTFSKVRFFGIKVPFHQQFGQINFRFYVKSKIHGTIGVVFIKEFAPKPLMAFVANTIYNEPFYYKYISSSKVILENKIAVEYSYKNIKVQASGEKFTKKLKENSLEHFVVDRYIVFVKNGKAKTYQYKINHKPWELYKTKAVNINKNILTLLPSEFKNAKLISTYFVDGSPISVKKGILQHTANSCCFNRITI